MKNKFCIRTRGPDHSKQIIDTLIRLGYDNPEFWSGSGENTNYCYAVDDSNCIRYESIISCGKYQEIQLKDLEGSVKISYNYLIL